MKKIQIGLYILLTSLLMLLLNQYVATSKIYEKKMGKIDQEYNQLNDFLSKKILDKEASLVIGNSYVESSFSLNEQRDNIAMFTVAGMPMVDILGVIENLPINTKITSIFIGLGYNYANPVGSSSAGFEKYFTKNSLMKLWSSIPLFRGASVTSRLLKEDILCVLSNITSIECSKDKNNDTVFSKNAVDHLKMMRKSSQRRYKEYAPFISSVHKNFSSYLQKMQVACKKRGIKLYAYTAPIYTEMYDKLTPDFINEFHFNIKNSGIDYVDLNQVFPNLDAMMFKNATHVSKDLVSEKTTNFILNNFNDNRFSRINHEK